MATRLYLRSALSQQSGRPVGTATTETDRGHAGVSRLICLTMSRTKSPGPTTWRAWTDDGSPSMPHMDLATLFISPPLMAQTMAAGQSWKVCQAHDSDPLADNTINAAAFLYLWRPGQGYVATLSDTDPTVRTCTIGGLQHIGYAAWREMSATLSQDIEVKLRDRIVCEYWLRKNSTPGYGQACYWDGTVDTYGQGDSAPDPATYVEYSSDLLLAEDIAMDRLLILQAARDMRVDDVNVGALDGGVTVSYEPTHVEHSVDQRMGVQRVDKVGERMTMTTNLLEASLENLRIAWGQPSGALSTVGTLSTLHVGGWQTVTEHALVLVGKAPGTDRTRTITVHKAVAIDTSAHSYSKDGRTVYPVTFVLVEDSSQGAGSRYMTVEDAAGPFEFA